MSKSQTLCSQRNQGTMQENSPAPRIYPPVPVYQFALFATEITRAPKKIKTKAAAPPTSSGFRFSPHSPTFQVGKPQGDSISQNPAATSYKP